MPADTSAPALAKQLLGILFTDRDRLLTIDNYIAGEHADPYMPATADAEYRLLAKRAVSNWMPLVISTSAQALYVDTFRRSAFSATKAEESTPEMDHWQFSRLDQQQHPIMRGALRFGHSFTLTEKVAKGVRTTGLSALKTAALFEDPANDITPYAALTVKAWAKDKVPGKAVLWDGLYRYDVTFTDFGSDSKVTVAAGRKHGAKECPVTRFAAYIDLEGRTLGVVEPLIPLQDRLNQTVFDLLVAQTGGSFKVRYATGMAPPLEMEPVYDEVTGAVVDQKPRRDENGNTIPAKVGVAASKFLFAKDEGVKFGQLDETPLDGYISSIDMSIRHLSAIAQVPPHHLLGQIANLSAEALQAAETSLLRMVEEFQSSFGESWERVFRLAAELAGQTAEAEDFRGEVIWRDMEQKSLAQSADALGKLSTQLGIPSQGLWTRVPNVTENELNTWKDLADKEPVAQLSDALSRSSGTRRTVPTPATTPAVGDDVPKAA